LPIADESTQSSHLLQDGSMCNSILIPLFHFNSFRYFILIPKLTKIVKNGKNAKMGKIAKMQKLKI